MTELVLADVSTVTAVKCANCNAESPAEILQLTCAFELGLPGRPPFLHEVIAYRIKALEPGWFWTVNEDGRFFMYMCPKCVAELAISCSGDHDDGYIDAPASKAKTREVH